MMLPLGTVALLLAQAHAQNWAGGGSKTKAGGGLAEESRPKPKAQVEVTPEGVEAQTQGEDPGWGPKSAGSMADILASGRTKGGYTSLADACRKAIDMANEWLKARDEAMNQTNDGEISLAGAMGGGAPPMSPEAQRALGLGVLAAVILVLFRLLIHVCIHGKLPQLIPTDPENGEGDVKKES